MKKLTLIAAIAVLATTFASCKKVYTCSCTSGGFSSADTYSKMTKSDAETKCANSDYAKAGASCSIK